MKKKINLFICDDQKTRFDSFKPHEIVKKQISHENIEIDCMIDYITINDDNSRFVVGDEENELISMNLKGNNVLVLDDVWAVDFDAKKALIDKFALSNCKLFIILYSTFNSSEILRKDLEELISSYKNNSVISFSESCVGFTRSSAGYRYLARKVFDLLPKAEEFFYGKQ